MLLEIVDGTVTRGGKEVLSHIHFEIHGTERIAVAGRNGAGKSTLLLLLAGELACDRDDKNPRAGIHTARKLSVGMLRQQAVENPEQTVGELAEEIFAAGGRDEKDEASFLAEFDRVFTGFGFRKEEKSKRLGEFSGGQQTKIALIRLLLTRPDLLLLDEPTNHLDVPSVEWLEEYLRGYGKAVVMVSHDRYFLDRTAEAVVEIEKGQCTRYAGNYSAYREEKRRSIVRREKAYEREQEEIRRLNGLIERFKHKPRKAAFARSRKKILERMPRTEKPEREEAVIHTEEIRPARPGGKWVVTADRLAIGYDKPLRELSVRIRRGQKIAVLGANGTGKSTLLKTIAGVLPPVKGKLSIGNGVEAAYFDQQQAGFAGDMTVLAHFRKEFPALDEREARTRLAGYLFRGRDLATPVGELSGGEKARLALAEILERRPNFLILDEPTNHMDIPARETLESILKQYRGTVLFASHDRYLVREIADALILLEEGEQSCLYYPFGYENYREKLGRLKSGKSPAALRRSEEAAMIAGFQAVPRAERGRLRELSQKALYEDWRFRLAGEELEACREEFEAEERRFLEAVSRMEEGDTQAQEKARQAYTRACLAWYEVWLEAHPEESPDAQSSS